MPDYFMPTLTKGDGSLDEEALASALRVLIGHLEVLTDAVCVSSRYNPEIVALVDEATNRAVGLAQAAWLADLDTSYKVTYSDLGRERLAWAIDMENNNKNENHENDEKLCEGES